MARTADEQTISRARPNDRQGLGARAPVVLTPDGFERLTARAEWLRNERLPELARNLEDPDGNGWADGEHARAAAELAELTNALGSAVTTDQLPENPDIVELGDEVVVEFPDGDTERFVVVSPLEAPLDDFRISIESPLSKALLGRRVGEEVEVEAPAGTYTCTIVSSRRYRVTA